MALTLRHWIALAILGCLAVAVAYLPPEQDVASEFPTDFRTPEKTRVARLSMAYNQTQDLLATVQFRDSLRRVLVARRRDTSAVYVSFGIRLPPTSETLVRAAVQQVWAQVDPLPGARLTFVLGGGRRYQNTYVLPWALDGHTCVASISLDWEVTWLRNPNTAVAGTNLQPWLRNVVAPCLYYGAFGRPGPEIEAWLMSRSLKPAYTADWTAPRTPIIRADDPQTWQSLAYSASFDALACVDGRPARCHPALLGTDEFRPAVVEGVVRRSFWVRSLPGEDLFLATLVHEMGREQFARFWRSSDSVGIAFAKAFGQPMDRWTGTWARDLVSGSPRFGPAPRPLAVLYGLLLGAIAVAGAATFVTRRQIS